MSKYFIILLIFLIDTESISIKKFTLMSTSELWNKQYKYNHPNQLFNSLWNNRVKTYIRIENLLLANDLSNFVHTYLGFY